MKLLQIQHITSSLHFPQSNGFAEAMVKIAKKLMGHSTLQEKPWNFSLMEYPWYTLLTANIPSPIELLTGCKPQMNLPYMPQDTSINREYCKAVIKKQQMDISDELSISTYEPGWNSMVLWYYWQNLETCHYSRTSPQTSLIPVQDGRLYSKTTKNMTSHQTMSKYDWVQRKANAGKEPNWGKYFPLHIRYEREWTINS